MEPFILTSRSQICDDHRRPCRSKQLRPWLSTGDFSDGVVDYASSDTFGVGCGCDDDGGTPAPTPGPTAVPTIGPTPAGGDCSAGSGITVTSTTFPDLEGCLREVDSVAGGELEYESDTGAIFAHTPVGKDLVRFLCVLVFVGVCSFACVFAFFAADKQTETMHTRRHIGIEFY